MIPTFHIWQERSRQEAYFNGVGFYFCSKGEPMKKKKNSEKSETKRHEFREQEKESQSKTVRGIRKRKLIHT